MSTTIFIEFAPTVTGKVLGDFTLSCKTAAGAAVSIAGVTLVELGFGNYSLTNPNVIEPTFFYIYLTADATQNTSGTFLLSDGDTALQTTLLAQNPIGPGSVSQDILIEVDGLPISGVEVYITSDITGTVVIAGTLLTDATGIVTFQLDPGDYYSWKNKAGYNFTNPQLITVPT